MLLLVVVAGLSVAASGVAGAEVDAALEGLLRGVRVRAVTEGRRQVSLPDLRRQWPLWPGDTAGTLDCSGGWAGDLSTLVRAGGSRLFVRGGRLVLTTALGLTSLQFGYTSCQVRLRPLFGVEAGFSVVVTNGNMTAEVSMGSTCSPQLDRLETRAGEVEVRLGGQGILDLLKDKLFSFLLDRFRSEFLGLVNQELSDLLKKQLHQLNFC